VSIIIILVLGSQIVCSAGQGPKVEFESTVFDLGQVFQNKSYDFVFKLKNNGDQSLTLTDIQTTCNCTILDTVPESVEPEKSAVIKGTFNSGSYKGRLDRDIILTTNDPLNTSVMLTIKAEVREVVLVKPERPFFLFNNGEPSSISIPLQVTNSIDKPFVIKEIKSKVDFLSAKVTNNDGQESTIEVTADYKKIPKFDFYYVVVELILTMELIDENKEDKPKEQIFKTIPITVFKESIH
jgi:hypothetical protein